MLSIVSKIFKGETPAFLWKIVFPIFLLLMFFSSATVIGRNHYRALMVITVFAFLGIAWFPSDSGRIALQFLRIGGGVPVSIFSKTMVPGGKDIIAQTTDGCLIL